MSIGAIEWISSRSGVCYMRRQRSKRCRVQVQRFIRSSRRRRFEEEGVGEDMELKNLKLYMENISILEENEKLRKKATILYQENLALMSEVQKKFSRFDCVSNTLS
ncbi:unnamed protein product [Ilex paraguariensis]|uniref:Uncharacterized protein n=1 Tax=Ilex paraguariensis TaxID=185542 RepID=A0ABC8QT85_9AQUA